MKAIIVSHWVGTLTREDPQRPDFEDRFGVKDWTDVTGQDESKLRQAPNVSLFEVQVRAAQLAAIRADPLYGDGAVLWCNGDKDEDARPTNTEHTQVRAKLTERGLTGTEQNATVGATRGTRNRREIAESLRVYLRALKQ